MHPVCFLAEQSNCNSVAITWWHRLSFTLANWMVAMSLLGICWLSILGFHQKPRARNPKQERFKQNRMDSNSKHLIYSITDRACRYQTVSMLISTTRLLITSFVVNYCATLITCKISPGFFIPVLHIHWHLIPVRARVSCCHCVYLHLSQVCSWLLVVLSLTKLLGDAAQHSSPDVAPAANTNSLVNIVSFVSVDQPTQKSSVQCFPGCVMQKFGYSWWWRYFNGAVAEVEYTTPVSSSPFGSCSSSSPRWSWRLRFFSM